MTLSGMDTNSPLPPPPPTTRQPVDGARRLYRAPSDERVIGGVAKGLAEYLKVSTDLVRLAFIIATFIGGLGLVMYVAGYLLIPERPPHVPANSSSSKDTISSAPAILGVVLILIAMSILFDDLWLWSGSVFWGLVLVVVGVLLFRRAQEEPQPHRVGAPAQVEHGYRGPGGTPPPAVGPSTYQAPPPRPQPKPARQRSPLGRLTIAVALIVTGLAFWLDQAGAVTLSGVQIGAAALAVLGGGLLIGTVFGRARWLLVLAVMLAVPLLIAASLRLPFDVTTGQRFIAPDSIAEIAPNYSLGFGQLQLDMSDVDFSGRTVEVDTDLGAGEVDITVPENVRVEVDSFVGLGEYAIFDRRGEGGDLRRSTVREGRSGSDGTLRIDASVGVGTLSITTSDSTEVLR